MTKRNLFGAISGILAVAGPLLAYLRVMQPMMGFSLMVLAGFFGLLGGAASLLLCVKRKAGKRDPLGALALLIPLILLGQSLRSSKYPPLNDVSSDLASPPEFVKALEFAQNRDRDFILSEEQKKTIQRYYPDIKSKRLSGTPIENYKRTLLLLHSRPDITLSREDDERTQIEGYAETPLFHFKDDFILRFQSEGEGTILDIRSKSRDGKGDLGANAQRIRTFFDVVEKNESNSK